MEMLFVLQAKLKDVFRRSIDGRSSKLSVNRLEVDIVVKMLLMAAVIFVEVVDFLPLVKFEIMNPFVVRERK